jgi:hypothetical protein
MAGCCVLGGWGWVSWTLSLPLGSIVVIIVSPPSPAEECRAEMCERGRGCGGNCLGIDTVQLLCCGRAGKASKRMLSWLSSSTASLKTVLFCKNGQSYKKNQNWRSSVHVKLKSTCTDNCQLTPVPLEREQSFAIMGGGISMVLKNQKLLVFVCPVFGYLRCCQAIRNRKCFPQNKKMEGTNGPDSLLL